MPKSTVLISSAILISLILLTITSYPVFAQDAATGSSVRKQLLQRNTELKKENIALRLKLETFKDKKKASAAARINTNLNLINQKETAQMQKHLSTISSILDKLEARVNQGTPDIKNPATAKTAIASARQAIATSSSAVVAQTQKDYTIQATTESRIKSDAKTQRDKLHTDLQALRKTVIDAKQTVSNAIRTTKSGSLQKETREGTRSGKQ